MSYSLNTAADAPAGVAIPAISSLEVSALEVPGLVSRFSARDVDVTARGLAYRDACSSLLWRGDSGVGHGVAPSTSRPAARFDGTTAAMLLADFTLPASYSIYALVTANTDKNFNTIFGHRTATGNRAWAVGDATRHLRLTHGVGELVSSSTYAATSAYVAMFGYDLASGIGCIGLNSATALVTGALPAHKGERQSAIGGIMSAGVGSQNMNGYIEEVWVFEGSHGLAGMEAERLAVMSALADRGGVTLT